MRVEMAERTICEWKNAAIGYKCEYCGAKSMSKTFFCPHCGSRMVETINTTNVEPQKPLFFVDTVKSLVYGNGVSVAF